MCEKAGTDQPDRSDVARIGHLAGKRAVGFRRARRGYTPAERWIVALADGSRVFAKIGVDRMTSDSLRTEQRVYAALEGDFMPQVRAWDDGARPLLLLEDLSACRWPPPWDTADVDRVLAALARLRDADPGGVLPALSVADPDLAGSWRRVAASPARFLSLGLATAGWLRGSASLLIAAAESALLDGPCPTHQDVRSDNLCFRRGSALLVDWNLAVLAHPDLDLAFWLPSLHAEGGPGAGGDPARGRAAGGGDQRLLRRACRQAADRDRSGRAPGAAPATAHGAAMGGARPRTGAARRSRRVAGPPRPQRVPVRRNSSYRESARLRQR